MDDVVWKITTIMDKSKYIGLSEEFISKGPFIEVPKDTTKTVEGRLIRAISDLKKRGKLSDEQYKRIYSTSGTIPILKGLPKLHKNPVTIRPIVTFNRSPLIHLSRFLAQLLKPITDEIQSKLCSSKQLVSDLQGIVVPSDYQLVSFDVVNMFPSIPLEEAIEAVQRAVEKHGIENLNTNLSLMDITLLLRLCTNNTFFTFNGHYYHQKDGTPMGSPLSEPLASLLVAEIEEKVFKNSSISPPIFWKRYVDDILCIIKKSEVNIYKEILNAICAKIKFTFDIENSGRISYLDVDIQRSQEGTLSFGVFRKETDSGLYFDHDSAHHHSQKNGIPTTLVNRARMICSDKERLEQEKERIRKDLQANNFPHNIIHRALSKEPTSSAHLNKDGQSPVARVSIPYNKGISERIARTLKKRNIQVTHRPTGKLSSLLGPRDETDKIARSGVVYKVPCAVCPQFYIGETGRRVGVRLEEHKKDVKEMSLKTGLSRHTAELGHLFNFGNFEILDTEKNRRARFFRETFHIAKNPGNVNLKQVNVTVPVQYADFLQPKSDKNQKSHEKSHDLIIVPKRGPRWQH